MLLPKVNDIKALGIREGKEIGRILEFLLNVVLEDPEKNEKEKLLLLAKEYQKIN